MNLTMIDLTIVNSNDKLTGIYLTLINLTKYNYRGQI